MSEDVTNGGEAEPDAAAGPREALIDAGLYLFGLYGYEGVSVRRICDAAQMNVAAINYHFGGKEGLYRAIAVHIKAQLQSHLSNEMVGALAFIQSEEDDPETALKHVIAIYRRIIHVLVPGSEQTARWARFIVKYQLGEDVSSHELDNIELMQLIGGLIGKVRGKPNDRSNILIGITLFGQILVFRINRRSSLRALNVDHIGPEETALIEATVLSNIRSILEAEMPK